MFPPNYPYYRCLFLAVCRHYKVEEVIKELVKMGWQPDSIKLTPEIVERSIDHMKGVVLYGEKVQ